LILSERQIEQLRKQTRIDLLMLLYQVEDDLQYKSKSVTRTIDYLQEYNKEH
jgi:hypothetical protein